MEPINLPKLIQELENTWIKAALEETDGNIAAAGELLGLKRTTLRAKVHKFQKPKDKIVMLIDPEGDFSIVRKKTVVIVKWQDEILKKFRTITEANAFMQEKMNE